MLLLAKVVVTKKAKCDSKYVRTQTIAQKSVRKKII